jgi:hypothetical protein
MKAVGSIGLEPTLKNPDGTPNFMGALVGNHYIDSAIFAIKFSTAVTDTSSHITIGDYDREVVGGNKIYWQNNLSPRRWNITLNDLLYDKKSILPKPSWILLTTGESRIRIYRDIFENIRKDLTKHFDCLFTDKDPMLRCYVTDESYSNFKIIELHLDGIVLYVEPHEYVIFVCFPHDDRKKK